MGREFFEDTNVLGFYGDVAAGREVTNDSAHHFSRAADARGNVGLSQALGHNPLAIALDGVFFQEAREVSEQRQRQQTARRGASSLFLDM